MGITLNVSVCRKLSDGDFGSVGASVGFDGIEVPAGSSAEQIASIHQYWLAIAEAAVGDELDRLRGEGTPGPSGRGGRFPSDDDRRQARDDDDGQGDEKAPTNGRQLLGWASKQDPDAKDSVVAYGKRKGFPSKVIDWNDRQVSAAYQAIRGTL